MKRLFAAIKVIPDDNFMKLYYRLLKDLDGNHINWVKPDNMHITLKFFGETEESRIGGICEIMDGISLIHKPFSFHLKDIGIFGSRYKPRVIWFGIENPEQIINLGVDLLQKLETAGFENDRQNFVPVFCSHKPFKCSYE